MPGFEISFQGVGINFFLQLSENLVFFAATVAIFYYLFLEEKAARPNGHGSLDSP